MPGKITPAEWDLMETVWELGGAPSVREVWEHRFPNGEKAYTTVQTIMNNLEKKGHLQRRKIGLVNFYSPTRPRKQVLAAEMSTVANRMFDGNMLTLANTLMNLNDLSIEEIKSIRAILDEKERQLREQQP